MKTLYIKDLKANDSLFGELFAVKNNQKKTGKNGEYADLMLSDKTGEIKAKMWSEALNKSEPVAEGEIAAVTAKVQDDPKFGMQLIITDMVPGKDFDAQDFMRTSKFDTEKMWQELLTYKSKIKNKYLKTTLDMVFTPEVTTSFKTSAAAMTVHHAYQGGLLEHTLEMLKMSDSLSGSYPKLNKDMLYSGIILHDLGKIVEYETGLIVKITTEGKLLGHIFIGSEMVRKSAPKDMPKNLLDELTHLILSHHGELEFGSPVKPRTVEAIALSRFDDASAKINASYNMVQELGEGVEFTAFHRQLGTELYRSPYLDELVNEDIPF
jgi:3'-5' exoribonuclease